MVESLGPRPIGSYTGVQRVVPTKDREAKKKKRDEEKPRRGLDDDDEVLRKGRRIDDHA
ncbi:MAG: hypothetical protein AB8C02_00865 [Halioglobus sp.]